MLLKNIKITDFRNINKADLNFNNKFNIIYGNNGNGKTNLLEAIYYTTTLKPIKNKNKLNHLIKDNCNYSIINSTFENSDYNEMIKLVITPQKRALIYNQNNNTDIKSYLHKFKSVLFTPDDLMIIKGDPEIRREFFNKSIFHANQYYYNYTLKYNQILKSRNKVLKELFEGLHKKTELLDVLDEQFTEISLQIYNERINYLIDYIPIFIETVKKLSDKDFLPYLIYKTEFNYKSKEAFLSKLKSKRQSEINQKRTLVGPHLDDYKIITNDKELKFFGSQGEIRLFTLAIKISHIIYIFEKTKSYPILLLDDISSELDEKRKLFLFNFLKTIDSQIFITTADLNSLPELEKVSFFEVVDGFFENKF